VEVAEDEGFTDEDVINFRRIVLSSILHVVKTSNLKITKLELRDLLLGGEVIESHKLELSRGQVLTLFFTLGLIKRSFDD
jgi:hypothetical protein